MIRKKKEKANIHNTTKNSISHLKNETENYSSIYNLKHLKESIKTWEARIWKYKLRIQTLEKYKKQWIKEVKIFYSKKRERYDTVTIDDAINLYKEMLKAWEISVRITKAWFDNAKDWNFNNKAAVKEARRQHRRLSSKEIHWLPGLFSYARWFENFTEHYHRGTLNKLVRFNILEMAWCGWFIAGVLKHEWYSLKNVRNPNTAGSYLGIQKWWYHVWIADWKWNYISWNVSWYNKKWEYISQGVIVKTLHNYIWWILPKDIWKKNKVHWRYEWITPPPWAIVIPYARKASVKAEAEHYAKYWTSNIPRHSRHNHKYNTQKHKTSTYYNTPTNKANTRKNKYKDPLSVLRTRP